MIDIRQSIQYANYLKLLGWNTERIDGTNYFIKKFPIIGSVLKLQRPEKIDFNTIDKLCRKYRVFQVIAEPKDASQSSLLAKNGFKLTKSPYLPSKTLQIDLSQSEKTILSHLKKDSRAAVKRGEVKNIKIMRTPSDIRKWHEAWKNSVNLDRYVPNVQQLLNLNKCFDDNNSLFLASHNIVSRIIGGALFTKTSHGVAYYWYGYTNDEGRSTLSQYSLLYQGILWAKKSGCKVFDFEGIYDSRFPNKSWLGFSHFKRSFGGYEVEYPGCYVKFRLPI
jgi:lipid II:glycine glycyltransferase (peptidoglycan interpeptide bridge formation enzyme)